MEDKLRLELDSNFIEEEDNVKADLEFYETIEAPKFVDFTRPNHFCPDDRYWFCSRVGCNQRHEEELDSDAIYKSFVMRVMAARSPNVRFQRALNRKPPSDDRKCPMSAPPKSSKPRIPRLALVSSVSRKLLDDIEKEAIKPGKTLTPTSKPKLRVKHVPAKYMTSPRKKKGSSPKPGSFQSVRNPKKTTVTLQKNTVIVKSLFSSPKKVVKAKTSDMATPVSKLCKGVKNHAITSEKKSVRKMLPKENTPVTKLCEGLQKLAITSEKKGVTQKSVGKMLPKKELTTPVTKLCEGLKKLAITSDKKGVTHKSVRKLLHKKDVTQKPSVRKLVPSEGNLRRKDYSASEKETVSAGSTDEISVPDSENAAAFPKPVTTDVANRKINEEDLENQNPGVIVEILASDDKENTAFQKPNTMDVANRKINKEDLENQNPGVIVEILASDDKESTAFQKSNTTDVANRKTNEEDLENQNPGVIVENLANDDKENAAFQKPNTKDLANRKTNEEDLENQNPGVIVEIADSDDKENTLNSNNMRKTNENVLRKPVALVKSKVMTSAKHFGTVQKIQNSDKRSVKDENTTTQGVKYKKLKPTNPKPFRLRTDERGILKEATLEKRVNSHENSIAASENLQYTEDGVSATREKTGKKVEEKTLKKISVKSKYKKTSKENPSSQTRIGRTKPSTIHKQTTLSEKENNSPVKLRKHDMPCMATMSKPKGGSKQQCKEAGIHRNKAASKQQCKEAGIHRNKAAVKKAMTTTTIPREFKFHTLHKNK